MRQLILALALIGIIGGCSTDANKVANSIPIAVTSTATASAHLQSAEIGTQAAIPHADDTGKAILGVVSTEHTAIGTAITATDTALAAAQTQRDQLVKDYNTAEAQVTTLDNSWGHKLQVIVTDLFWVIVALVVLHVICVGLAMFLPPPYSVIAGTVGSIINPLGWGTWIIQNFKNSPAPLVVNPAVTATAAKS